MKHHAYLAAGTLADWKALKQPDRLAFNYETLGINEARELRRQQTQSNQTFLIYFDAMTTEAQNALLKTLEEPARENIFILITPNPDLLLPTLLSRVEKLELTRTSDQNLENIEKFVKSDLSKKLILVNKIETKSEAILFLNNLEQYYYNTNYNTKNVVIYDVMRAIWTGREYLHDKSGTVKLVLEQVALMLQFC